jgi:NAD(P)-dependent dehydrogenase (short-subunit alcohol dehydrogenase family)
MSERVCLIIGAGSGLGAGLARTFAAAGLTVCLVRRHSEPLQPLLDDIRSKGVDAHGFAVDARDPAALGALFDHVEQTIGPIEVTIFNVGGNVRAGVLETSAETYLKTWQTSALAGFLTGQQAARVMQPRGRGTILFTGATASMRGGLGFSAFAAAKTALRAFAQSLAREFGPQGIHVAHIVVDGGIDSPRIREQQPVRLLARMGCCCQSIWQKTI